MIILVLLVMLLAPGCGAEAAESAFEVTGIGGAGGMYTPMVSPYDANLMLLSCDMGGCYRSLDGGGHWELLHYREISSATGCRPHFLPSAVLWASGPMLKVSRDKGATWQPLVAGQAPWGSAAVTRLASDPIGHETLLVGTDTGLWVGRLSGKSWRRVLAGRCAGIVWLGDRVFAALQQEQRVFWRSADRGETWEAVAVPAAREKPLASLTGGVAGGKSVLFATVSGVGTLRSRDGGASWRLVQEDQGQNDILMAANQTSVAYAAARRDVFRTTDGGENWARCFRMESPDPNVERSWVQTELRWGYYITALGLGISPADARTVMATTQGDVYLSRDAGESWKPIMNLPVGVRPGDPGFRYRSNGLEVTSCWQYSIDPFDPQRHFICYTDIGFARSVDAGQTWSWSARGAPWSNTFYQIAFDPHVPGKIYAATSNRHDIPHWTHTDSNTPQHAGGVCVSEDGGVSWRALGTGLPALPCTSIAIDPRSPRGRLTLYTTLYEGGVYKSTDNGATWVRKSEGLGRPGNLHALQVWAHPRTGDVYCGITAHRHGTRFPVSGGIWKSRDGGDTWTEITAGLNLAWPGHFAVHPDNPAIIYLTAATVPGGRQGGLYQTTDGGRRWMRLLRDEDLAPAGGAGYVHCLYVNLQPGNPDRLYLGTAGHGLWTSLDTGKSWQLIEAFPFRAPTNVAFDPRELGVIRVLTFGAGVWKGRAQP